ncbi:cytochrome C oxidase subunit IV family protein [Mycobacterium sp. URHB0044]|uniref:cytochrome C oxidase subunit IV family protein n=1 Tax=Mycobacterium sp. URHB0044 TaxID=1380386 RepID=UPI000567D5C2|nr:cytochrome C oxidase subunit IV family protein [Mycobacterium sp. URHB0044]
MLSVKNRLTVVWLALAGLTCASWALAPGREHGSVVASVPITVAVLAMALIKSRLIIREFMEVRTAPAWLRAATDAWLVVMFGGILAIYLW